jgi:hypothetical protein
MGIIRTIKCSTCGFTLIAGSAGVAPYVKKPKGFLKKLFGLGEKKVFLQDPPTSNLSKNFGDKELSDLIEEKRVGHYASYLCLSCLKVFDLDSSSEKKCKHCKSTSVKTVFEMVGEKCPKYKESTSCILTFMLSSISYLGFTFCSELVSVVLNIEDSRDNRRWQILGCRILPIRNNSPFKKRIRPLSLLTY